MNATEEASAQVAGRPAPSRASLVAVIGVGAATALAVLLSGHPAAAVAPVLLAAAIWAIFTGQLRAPAAILGFVLLSVDDSTDANDIWHSPLAPFGDLLRRSLRTTIPGSVLPLTGIEIAVLVLLAAAAWRSARGARDPAHIASPRAVMAVGLVYLGALGLAVANGLMRGGNLEMAVWQTRPLVTTAALFVVFEAAFRGPRDHAALGQIVVAAACVRALLAMWIRWVIIVEPEAREAVAFVTNHGDSMLFSLACTILIAHLLERWDRRRLLNAFVLLPILLLGIVANGRRTAWIQLALVPAVFFLVGRTARWKIPLARLALLAAPLIALYAATGWNASSPIYEPVRAIRSVVDTRIDRSTWNRQVENWNLAMSMRPHPIVGRGFGHEWTEFFRGDEITTVFFRYKAEPHNQVLGLLLFAGALGFAAIWAPFAFLVLLAARAYPRARTPEQRAAALSVAATAAILFIQCFSDLGPFSYQYWVLGALALATGGKLATATAAWR